MFFIEYIGRKPIQVGGFLVEGILLAVVAGDFGQLSTQPAGFLLCFILLQFFFNFGANTTTFVYPAEIFPTRVRGANTKYQHSVGHGWMYHRQGRQQNHRDPEG